MMTKLKSILEKYDVTVLTGGTWLIKVPVTGSCEHTNEPSGSKNRGDFLG
jgi:hypothetical protein